MPLPHQLQGYSQESQDDGNDKSTRVRSIGAYTTQTKVVAEPNASPACKADISPPNERNDASEPQSTFPKRVSWPPRPGCVQIKDKANRPSSVFSAQSSAGEDIDETSSLVSGWSRESRSPPNPPTEFSEASLMQRYMQSKRQFHGVSCPNLFCVDAKWKSFSQSLVFLSRSTPWTSTRQLQRE
jgi:hypothetical protein